MLLGELDRSCGECSVTEYCGNPFEFCLCMEERFANLEDRIYSNIAEMAIDIKKLDVCKGCERPDCGAYRYSKVDFEDEDCEFNDEARNYYCEQIADFVYKEILLFMKTWKR